MNGKTILIFFVLAAVAIGIAVSVDKSRSAAATSLPLASATPPANAIFLEPGTPPAAIYMAVARPKESEQEAAIASYVDIWLPKTGWSGDVKKVNVSKRKISIEVHDITIPGFLFIIAEFPDGVEGIDADDNAAIMGRIADIEISHDPLTVPHRIIIDRASMIKLRKPGG